MHNKKVPRIVVFVEYVWECTQETTGEINTNRDEVLGRVELAENVEDWVHEYFSSFTGWEEIRLTDPKNVDDDCLTSREPDLPKGFIKFMVHQEWFTVIPPEPILPFDLEGAPTRKCGFKSDVFKARRELAEALFESIKE